MEVIKKNGPKIGLKKPIPPNFQEEFKLERVLPSWVWEKK